jgi:hypothetical protein
MQDSPESSNDYMLGAFDCALFVCDALSSGMDPNDLLREMSNIVVKFNDTRVVDFMKGMNVDIALKPRMENADGAVVD